MASDTPIRAIKTGMLLNSDNVNATVRALKRNYEDGAVIPPLVVDPVSISTSGHILLDPTAIDVMIDELFPIAVLVTPNKSEAELILSRKALEPRKLETLQDMYLAARSLASFGCRAVLIKGGHLTSSRDDLEALLRRYPEIRSSSRIHVVDDIEILKTGLNQRRLVVNILHEGSSGETTLSVRPHIDSTSTHGTGCTLSAAIASHLALGVDCASTAIRGSHNSLMVLTMISSARCRGPSFHFHS